MKLDFLSSDIHLCCVFIGGFLSLSVPQFSIYKTEVILMATTWDSYKDSMS